MKVLKENKSRKFFASPPPQPKKAMLPDNKKIIFLLGNKVSLHKKMIARSS
jgi:hypothetical protein